ncbi:MAG TPA: hypothetical protein PKA63_08055 [Oligoflexia bacterium]|nr:hypothetical protein [Oligoflexia bacterium]HMP48603.1 hypothetical protein [Oligoflexia bacterium]
MTQLKSHLNSVKSSIIKELELEDTLHTRQRPVGALQPPGSEIMPVVHSDELRYLNKHWAEWSRPSEFPSHRKFTGSIISLIKKRIQRFLFNSIFSDYLSQEREFVMNMVRFCNITAQYIDHRDQKIFWDTVRKLDSETVNLERRYDALLVASRDEIGKRISGGIESEIKQIRERIHVIERRLIEVFPSEFKN